MSHRRRGQVIMDEPRFNDRRFAARHALAMLVHLPLVVLLMWMMLEARTAGAFNIVWLYFAFFVFVPGVWIAASCIEPWLEGARRFTVFRLLLILDCAIALAPMLIMLWLTLVFALGSWPQFFKVPFQLYSLATFGETVVGVLAIMVVCGAYAWFSLRAIYFLLFRPADANAREVLGELAAPESHWQIKQADLTPENDILSHRYVPPPVVRPRPPPRPEPKVPPTPPYTDRPPELGKRFVHGEWRSPWYWCSYAVTDERGKEKCRELGWPAFEWVLRTEPSREELMSAIKAMPSLAAVLDDIDASLARNWLERFCRDTRSWTVSVIPRDYGDPDFSTHSFAESAQLALRQWDDERRAAAK